METNPFSSLPPEWAAGAEHGLPFCCPRCKGTPQVAQQVWINRRSPVFIEGFNRRKWQEFYLCECDMAWWGWSNDRPIPDWLQERNARQAEQAED